MLLAEDAIQAGQVRLQLTLDGGRQRLAWPVASGKFSFPEVPHGSHLLDILAVGVLYPQVCGRAERTAVLIIVAAFSQVCRLA